MPGLIERDYVAGCGYKALAGYYESWATMRSLRDQGYFCLSDGGAVLLATNNGAATTVAAGSNGGDITQIATWGAGFGGNGVLKTAANPAGTTPAFPATGQAIVSTTAGYARFSYTSLSADGFHGCALVEGSGLVATGSTISFPAVKIPAFTGQFAGTGQVAVAATDNICVPAPDPSYDKWHVLEVASNGAYDWVIGTLPANPPSGADGLATPPDPTANEIAIGAIYQPPAGITLNTSLLAVDGAGKLFDCRVLRDFYPLGSTVAAVLGSNATINATETNILTTGSLGIGTWLVTMELTAFSGAAQNIDAYYKTGTATVGSVSGARAARATVANAAWNTLTFTFVIVITAAGTISLKAIVSTGTSTAEATVDLTPATGITAVQIG